jgi:hypothetical protein
MHEVGLALKNQGRYKAAEAMNRQTLALSETVLGREHPDTLLSVYSHKHNRFPDLVLAFVLTARSMRQGCCRKDGGVLHG